LEKLAGLPDAGPISRELVGELVGVRHGETLEDWVEAVLANQPSRTLELTGRVLEQSGMSGVKMITALGTSLIGVKLARAHYDRGSRGGALERVLIDRFRQVRPFGLGDWKQVARSWSHRAEAWSGARLNAALRATLEADTALKGTRISDEAGVVTDLVLRLAADGRSGGPADRNFGGTQPLASLNIP
jgi:DNA polymerase III delta subunit